MQTAVVQGMNQALGCVAQRVFKVAVGKVSECMRRHARSVGVALYLKCELVQVCTTAPNLTHHPLTPCLHTLP